MSVTIESDISLQSLNTMAVPAQAKYFAWAKSVDEISQAIQFAKDEKLDIFVLGEGSNTLFTQDYSGLIIHNCLLGIELLQEDDQTILVKVAAGENWHRFVVYAVQQGWYGLENLALIPGLVGAAPIQNIGAYGVEVKDSITAVEYLDFETQKLTVMDNSNCEFAYRDSVFKQSLQGKGYISAVFFQLNKSADVNLSYPALANFFAKEDKPTAKQVLDAVVKIRSEKLPAPSVIPNLGSFFKNPIVGQAQHEKLKDSYPDLISYSYKKDYKLAAAWLIDKAGWKSRTINDVRVHSQQALVIINPDKVAGEHVLSFANEIRASIWQKFDVELEIEPIIL